MRRLNILFIAVITVFTLNSCCLVDYSKTIEKVAEPMLKELDMFYKKNKRYPTLKERNTMLTKVGCSMKNDICSFKKEKIVIKSKIESYGVYRISMGILDGYNGYIAHCGFAIEENGETEYVICFDEPCIQIRQ